MWSPYYDLRKVINKQKFIVHVNQESGEKIIRDIVHPRRTQNVELEDLFGFNWRNIVFAYQDVYNTWAYEHESRHLELDYSHSRPFGHGQLAYDAATRGIAFVMKRGRDGVYRQKILRKDAFWYLYRRGAREFDVEEIADLNMLVHPLKLDQDVIAEEMFARGYNYAGRAAVNPTGQKGGYMLITKQGVNLAGIRSRMLMRWVRTQMPLELRKEYFVMLCVVVLQLICSRQVLI